MEVETGSFLIIDVKTNLWSRIREFQKALEKLFSKRMVLIITLSCIFKITQFMLFISSVGLFLVTSSIPFKLLLVLIVGL